MATINDLDLGTAADDGTGDPIRAGGEKINANTQALNTELTALLTAMGIASGATDLGVFTGTLLGDNQTVAALLQEIEDAVSGNKVLSPGYTAQSSPFSYPAAADTLETAVSKLHSYILSQDEGIVMAGTWDASSGAFPTVGTASDGTVKAGNLYIVSVAGTHDGVDFEVDDRIVSLVDGPDTATYAANWFHRDYSPDFSTDAPPQAIDATGDAGVAGTVMRSDARAPLDVIPELIAADTTVTLDPATGSGVQRLLVLDSTGPALTVAPTAGESLNGEVDGTRVYDAGNSQIVAVDVAAGQWQVSATSSFGGTTARLGEFFFAKSGKTDSGLLAVSAGTVTNGAALYPKWSAMYPEFVSGADIVFPADVEGMFLRNVGGNAGTEGAAQADATAANSLRLRTSSNAGGNVLNATTSMFTNTGNVGTQGSVIPQGDNETRPANRAFQLYTIVDGYGDTFAAGTLIAEPAWELLADGNGAWTADETVPLLGGRTWQDILNEFDEIHVSLQENDFSFYRVSANHFTEDLRIDGTQDIEIWTYSSGATGYRMWIESPNITQTSLQVSNGGHGHRDFVMRGRRKQFNAIRAEDTPVTQTVAAGSILEDRGDIREESRVETGGTSGTITFTNPFASAPIVTANAIGNGHVISFDNITATGFTYNQWDVSNVQQGGPFGWTAKGPKP